MGNNHSNIFKRLKGRYKQNFLVKVLLLTSAIMLLLFLNKQFQSNSGFLFWIFSSLSLGFIFYFVAAKIHFSDNKIIELINKSNPNLEFSSALFNKRKLSAVEAIQVQRIAERRTSKTKNSAFWLRYLVMLLFISGLIFNSSLFSKEVSVINSQKNTFDKPTDNESGKEESFFAMINKKFRYQSPAYLGGKTFSAKSNDNSIAEGSRLFWEFELNKSPSEFLITENGVNIKNDRESGDKINYEYVIKNSVIHEFEFKNDSIIRESYLSSIIPDFPPEISLTRTDFYKSIEHYDLKNPAFNIQFNDDHGIDSLLLIITHSSGEGESVKFNQKTKALSKTIKEDEKIVADIKSFEKVVPGDDFFIRFKVKDNCPFRNQYAYSSSFVLHVKDTASESSLLDNKLAMDIMPEYFRSQRQIIIDTKNLIAKKNEISIQEFKDQSNNIAIDQKLLRLRYGMFLGEEFEGEIGGGIVNDQHIHELSTAEKDDTLTLRERILRLRTVQKEKEKKKEEKKQDDHNHQHSASNEFEDMEDGKEKERLTESLLEPFIHSHDHSDINTFFDSEVKSKLKAAIQEMWNAELSLRIAEPLTAIPFEEEALKLIKEVQQASRVYVAKTAFEAPVIPEEKKRLSGEMDLAILKSKQGKEQKQVLKTLFEKGETIFNEYLNTYQIENTSIQDLQQLNQLIIQEKDNLPLESLKLLYYNRNLQEGKLSSSENTEALTIYRSINKILPENTGLMESYLRSSERIFNQEF